MSKNLSSLKTVKNILVIRFRRVGDAVLSSSICTTLHKTFPDAKIDYVLNHEIAPLFEYHADIDKIIAFSRSEIKDCRLYIEKVRLIMQETEYDLIIDIRSTFKTVLFSVFSLKSPYRIGRKKLYNYFIHNYRVDTLVDGDEISRALSILKPLEKDFEVKYDRNFRIYVSDEKKMIFRTKMKLYGIDFSKPVIVCAVATRIHNKMWEQEKMTALLARIIKNFDVQLIFNYGSFAEKKIAFQIKKAIGNNSQIFTDINAGNLGELAALIANSDFFLGNEGGPRHISQALDIPSFAIYPHGADKKFWLPNACERFQGIEAEDITEQTKDKNLSSKEKFAFVTVDEVWKRIKPMLDILFS